MATITDARRKTLKKKMIKAMESTLGIVTDALAIVKDLNRSTHYLWMKEDPEYRKAIESIDEITFDMVESKLFENIKEGKERSIGLYIKYKGHKRDYKTTVDQQVTGTLKVNSLSDEDLDARLALLQAKAKDGTN